MTKLTVLFESRHGYIDFFFLIHCRLSIDVKEKQLPGHLLKIFPFLTWEAFGEHLFNNLHNNFLLSLLSQVGIIQECTGYTQDLCLQGVNSLVRKTDK